MPEPGGMGVKRLRIRRTRCQLALYSLYPSDIGEGMGKTSGGMNLPFGITKANLSHLSHTIAKGPFVMGPTQIAIL